MTLISEHIEPDTRERILVVAERLFRQIGYQKTTVADIAKELRMSPANVYRFFDSKKAIHEGVARVLMGEVEVEAQRIATTAGPAAVRLREMMKTIVRSARPAAFGDVRLHRHDALLPSPDDRPMRDKARPDHRPDDRFCHRGVVTAELRLASTPVDGITSSLRAQRSNPGPRTTGLLRRVRSSQ